MNQSVGVPASEWLGTVSASELTWVLQQTCHKLDSPLPERIAEEVLECVGRPNQFRARVFRLGFHCATLVLVEKY
jgi:hypothetical protein